MKVTGSRADRFCQKPGDDIFGALVFGPDRGLARERSEILCKSLAGNVDADFGMTVLTADDLSGDIGKLADEMSAMSMFGDIRLVRVRLDNERQGAAIAKLIRELDSNPQKIAARLVIEGGDMASRSAVRKAFEAAKHFAAIPCYEANARDLANLVRDGLAGVGEHPITISREALERWTPLLEGDRALAKGEIEKMALYKGYGQIPGAQVELQDVVELASGAQSAGLDDIIYPAFSGKADEADSAYTRALGSKVPAALILRAIQNHLIRLHQARSMQSGGKSASEAMRALRPPVFIMRQNDFSRHLSLWSLPALTHAIGQALETDRRIKTAGSPAESLLGRYILALSMQAARRR